MKSSPLSAFAGRSVLTASCGFCPFATYRSTNAWDDTKPRVKVTFSLPGWVSRRSSIAALCGSP